MTKDLNWDGNMPKELDASAREREAQLHQEEEDKKKDLPPNYEDDDE